MVQIDDKLTYYTELVEAITNSGSYSNINTNRMADLIYYFKLTDPSNFYSKDTEDTASQIVNLFTDSKLQNRDGEHLLVSKKIHDKINITGNVPEGKFNSQFDLTLKTKKGDLHFFHSELMINSVGTYILDKGRYELQMQFGTKDYKDDSAVAIFDIKSLDDRNISIYFKRERNTQIAGV